MGGSGGREGRALIQGISALAEESWERSLAPSTV